jgi:hypothetical protein
MNRMGGFSFSRLWKLLFYSLKKKVLNMARKNSPLSPL